jgi:CheY-like chemotaxis protein
LRSHCGSQSIFFVIFSRFSDTVERKGSYLIPSIESEHTLRGAKLELARVLLVDDEIASRLTLQTILEAGGYSVDVAACTSEALDLLDDRQYELVLSGSRSPASPSKKQVLNYARLKPYKPATAVVTAYHEGGHSRSPHQQVSIDTEDVSLLLDKVAGLISARASRRSRRNLRQAV